MLWHLNLTYVLLLILSTTIRNCYQVEKRATDLDEVADFADVIEEQLDPNFRNVKLSIDAVKHIEPELPINKNVFVRGGANYTNTNASRVSDDAPGLDDVVKFKMHQLKHSTIGKHKRARRANAKRFVLSPMVSGKTYIGNLAEATNDAFLKMQNYAATLVIVVTTPKPIVFQSSASSASSISRFTTKPYNNLHDPHMKDEKIKTSTTSSINNIFKRKLLKPSNNLFTDSDKKARRTTVEHVTEHPNKTTTIMSTTTMVTDKNRKESTPKMERYDDEDDPLLLADSFGRPMPNKRRIIKRHMPNFDFSPIENLQPLLKVFTLPPNKYEPPSPTTVKANRHYLRDASESSQLNPFLNCTTTRCPKLNPYMWENSVLKDVKFKKDTNVTTTTSNNMTETTTSMNSNNETTTSTSTSTSNTTIATTTVSTTLQTSNETESKNSNTTSTTTESGKTTEASSSSTTNASNNFTAQLGAYSATTDHSTTKHNHKNNKNDTTADNVCNGKNCDKVIQNATIHNDECDREYVEAVGMGGSYYIPSNDESEALLAQEECSKTKPKTTTTNKCPSTTTPRKEELVNQCSNYDDYSDELICSDGVLSQGVPNGPIKPDKACMKSTKKKPIFSKPKAREKTRERRQVATLLPSNVLVSVPANLTLGAIQLNDVRLTDATSTPSNATPTPMPTPMPMPTQPPAVNLTTLPSSSSTNSTQRVLTSTLNAPNTTTTSTTTSTDNNIIKKSVDKNVITSVIENLKVVDEKLAEAVDPLHSAQEALDIATKCESTTTKCETNAAASNSGGGSGGGGSGNYNGGGGGGANELFADISDSERAALQKLAYKILNINNTTKTKRSDTDVSKQVTTPPSYTEHDSLAKRGLTSDLPFVETTFLDFNDGNEDVQIKRLKRLERDLTVANELENILEQIKKDNSSTYVKKSKPNIEKQEEIVVGKTVWQARTNESFFKPESSKFLVDHNLDDFEYYDNSLDQLSRYDRSLPDDKKRKTFRRFQRNNEEYHDYYHDTDEKFTLRYPGVLNIGNTDNVDSYTAPFVFLPTSPVIEAAAEPLANTYFVTMPTSPEVNNLLPEEGNEPAIFTPPFIVDNWSRTEPTVENPNAVTGIPAFDSDSNLNLYTSNIALATPNENILATTGSSNNALFHSMIEYKEGSPTTLDIFDRFLSKMATEEEPKTVFNVDNMLNLASAMSTTVTPSLSDIEPTLVPITPINFDFLNSTEEESTTKAKSNELLEFNGVDKSTTTSTFEKEKFNGNEMSDKPLLSTNLERTTKEFTLFPKATTDRFASSKTKNFETFETPDIQQLIGGINKATYSTEKFSFDFQKTTESTSKESFNKNIWESEYTSGKSETFNLFENTMSSNSQTTLLSTTSNPVTEEENETNTYTFDFGADSSTRKSLKTKSTYKPGHTTAKQNSKTSDKSSTKSNFDNSSKNFFSENTTAFTEFVSPSSTLFESGKSKSNKTTFGSKENFTEPTLFLTEGSTQSSTGLNFEIEFNLPSSTAFDSSNSNSNEFTFDSKESFTKTTGFDMNSDYELSSPSSTIFDSSQSKSNELTFDSKENFTKSTLLFSEGSSQSSMDINSDNAFSSQSSTIFDSSESTSNVSPNSTRFDSSKSQSTESTLGHKANFTTGMNSENEFNSLNNTTLNNNDLSSSQTTFASNQYSDASQLSSDGESTTEKMGTIGDKASYLHSTDLLSTINEDVSSKNTTGSTTPEKASTFSLTITTSTTVSSAETETSHASATESQLTTPTMNEEVTTLSSTSPTTIVSSLVTDESHASTTENQITISRTTDNAATTSSTATSTSASSLATDTSHASNNESESPLDIKVELLTLASEQTSPSEMIGSTSKATTKKITLLPSVRTTQSGLATLDWKTTTWKATPAEEMKVSLEKAEPFLEEKFGDNVITKTSTASMLDAENITEEIVQSTFNKAGLTTKIRTTYAPRNESDVTGFTEEKFTQSTEEESTLASTESSSEKMKATDEFGEKSEFTLMRDKTVTENDDDDDTFENAFSMLTSENFFETESDDEDLFSIIMNLTSVMSAEQASTVQGNSTEKTTMEVTTSSNVTETTTNSAGSESLPTENIAHTSEIKNIIGSSIATTMEHSTIPAESTTNLSSSVETSESSVSMTNKENTPVSTTTKETSTETESEMTSSTSKTESVTETSIESSVTELDFNLFNDVSKIETSMSPKSTTLEDQNVSLNSNISSSSHSDLTEEVTHSTNANTTGEFIHSTKNETQNSSSDDVTRKAPSEYSPITTSTEKAWQIDVNISDEKVNLSISSSTIPKTIQGIQSSTQSLNHKTLSDPQTTNAEVNESSTSTSIQTTSKKSDFTTFSELETTAILKSEYEALLSSLTTTKNFGSSDETKKTPTTTISELSTSMSSLSELTTEKTTTNSENFTSLLTIPSKILETSSTRESPKSAAATTFLEAEAQGKSMSLSVDEENSTTLATTTLKSLSENVMQSAETFSSIETPTSTNEIMSVGFTTSATTANEPTIQSLQKSEKSTDENMLSTSESTSIASITETTVSTSLNTNKLELVQTSQTTTENLKSTFDIMSSTFENTTNATTTNLSTKESSISLSTTELWKTTDGIFSSTTASTSIATPSTNLLLTETSQLADETIKSSTVSDVSTIATSMKSTSLSENAMKSVQTSNLTTKMTTESNAIHSEQITLEAIKTSKLTTEIMAARSETTTTAKTIISQNTTVATSAESTFLSETTQKSQQASHSTTKIPKSTTEIASTTSEANFSTTSTSNLTTMSITSTLSTENGIRSQPITVETSHHTTKNPKSTTEKDSITSESTLINTSNINSTTVTTESKLLSANGTESEQITTQTMKTPKLTSDIMSVASEATTESAQSSIETEIVGKLKNLTTQKFMSSKSFHDSSTQKSAMLGIAENLETTLESIPTQSEIFSSTEQMATNTDNITTVTIRNTKKSTKPSGFSINLSTDEISTKASLASATETSASLSENTIESAQTSLHTELPIEPEAVNTSMYLATEQISTNAEDLLSASTKSLNESLETQTLSTILESQKTSFEIESLSTISSSENTSVSIEAENSTERSYFSVKTEIVKPWNFTTHITVDVTTITSLNTNDIQSLNSMESPTANAETTPIASESSTFTASSANLTTLISSSESLSENTIQSPQTTQNTMEMLQLTTQPTSNAASISNLQTNVESEANDILTTEQTSMHSENLSTTQKSNLIFVQNASTTNERAKTANLTTVSEFDNKTSTSQTIESEHLLSVSENQIETTPQFDMKNIFLNTTISSSNSVTPSQDTSSSHQISQSINSDDVTNYLNNPAISTENVTETESSTTENIPTTKKTFIGGIKTIATKIVDTFNKPLMKFTKTTAGDMTTEETANITNATENNDTLTTHFYNLTTITNLVKTFISSEIEMVTTKIMQVFNETTAGTFDENNTESNKMVTSPMNIGDTTTASYQPITVPTNATTNESATSTISTMYFTQILTSVASSISSHWPAMLSSASTESTATEIMEIENTTTSTSINDIELITISNTTVESNVETFTEVSTGKSTHLKASIPSKKTKHPNSKLSSTTAMHLSNFNKTTESLNINSTLELNETNSTLISETSTEEIGEMSKNNITTHMKPLSKDVTIHFKEPVTVFTATESPLVASSSFVSSEKIGSSIQSTATKKKGNHKVTTTLSTSAEPSIVNNQTNNSELLTTISMEHSSNSQATLFNETDFTSSTVTSPSNSTMELSSIMHTPTELNTSFNQSNVGVTDTTPIEMQFTSNNRLSSKGGFSDALTSLKPNETTLHFNSIEFSTEATNLTSTSDTSENLNMMTTLTNTQGLDKESHETTRKTEIPSNVTIGIGETFSSVSLSSNKVTNSKTTNFTSISTDKMNNNSMIEHLTLSTVTSAINTTITQNVTQSSIISEITNFNVMSTSESIFESIASISSLSVNETTHHGTESGINNTENTHVFETATSANTQNHPTDNINNKILTLPNPESTIFAYSSTKVEMLNKTEPMENINSLLEKLNASNTGSTLTIENRMNISSTLSVESGSQVTETVGIGNSTNLKTSNTTSNIASTSEGTFLISTGVTTSSPRNTTIPSNTTLSTNSTTNVIAGILKSMVTKAGEALNKTVEVAKNVTNAPFVVGEQLITLGTKILDALNKTANLTSSTQSITKTTNLNSSTSATTPNSFTPTSSSNSYASTTIENSTIENQIFTPIANNATETTTLLSTIYFQITPDSVTTHNAETIKLISNNSATENVTEVSTTFPNTVSEINYIGNNTSSPFNNETGTSANATDDMLTTNAFEKELNKTGFGLTNFTSTVSVELDESAATPSVNATTSDNFTNEFIKEIEKLKHPSGAKIEYTLFNYNATRPHSTSLSSSNEINIATESGITTTESEFLQKETIKATESSIMSFTTNLLTTLTTAVMSFASQFASSKGIEINQSSSSNIETQTLATQTTTEINCIACNVTKIKDTIPPNNSSQILYEGTTHPLPSLNTFSNVNQSTSSPELKPFETNTTRLLVPNVTVSSEESSTISEIGLNRTEATIASVKTEFLTMPTNEMNITQNSNMPSGAFTTKPEFKDTTTNAFIKAICPTHSMSTHIGTEYSVNNMSPSQISHIQYGLSNNINETSTNTIFSSGKIEEITTLKSEVNSNQIPHQFSLPNNNISETNTNATFSSGKIEEITTLKSVGYQMNITTNSKEFLSPNEIPNKIQNVIVVQSCNRTENFNATNKNGISIEEIIKWFHTLESANFNSTVNQSEFSPSINQNVTTTANINTNSSFQTITTESVSISQTNQVYLNSSMVGLTPLEATTKSGAEFNLSNMVMTQGTSTNFLTPINQDNHTELPHSMNLASEATTSAVFGATNQNRFDSINAPTDSTTLTFLGANNTSGYENGQCGRVIYLHPLKNFSFNRTELNDASTSNQLNDADAITDESISTSSIITEFPEDNGNKSHVFVERNVLAQKLTILEELLKKLDALSYRAEKALDNSQHTFSVKSTSATPVHSKHNYTIVHDYVSPNITSATTYPTSFEFSLAKKIEPTYSTEIKTTTNVYSTNFESSLINLAKQIQEINSQLVNGNKLVLVPIRQTIDNQTDISKQLEFPLCKENVTTTTEVNEYRVGGNKMQEQANFVAPHQSLMDILASVDNETNTRKTTTSDNNSTNLVDLCSSMGNETNTNKTLIAESNSNSTDFMDMHAAMKNETSAKKTLIPESKNNGLLEMCASLGNETNMKKPENNSTDLMDLCEPIGNETNTKRTTTPENNCTTDILQNTTSSTYPEKVTPSNAGTILPHTVAEIFVPVMAANAGYKKYKVVGDNSTNSTNKSSTECEKLTTHHPCQTTTPINCNNSSSKCKIFANYLNSADNQTSQTQNLTTTPINIKEYVYKNKLRQLFGNFNLATSRFSKQQRNSTWRGLKNRKYKKDSFLRNMFVTKIVFYNKNESNPDKVGPKKCYPKHAKWEDMYQFFNVNTTPEPTTLGLFDNIKARLHHFQFMQKAGYKTVNDEEEPTTNDGCSHTRHHYHYNSNELPTTPSTTTYNYYNESDVITEPPTQQNVEIMLVYTKAPKLVESNISQQQQATLDFKIDPDKTDIEIRFPASKSTYHTVTESILEANQYAPAMQNESVVTIKTTTQQQATSSPYLKAIYLDLPTFLPNSTMKIPNFQDYYSTTASSLLKEVFDDEMYDSTLDTNQFRSMSFHDFDTITEYTTHDRNFTEFPCNASTIFNSTSTSIASDNVSVPANTSSMIYEDMKVVENNNNTMEFKSPSDLWTPINNGTSESNFYTTTSSAYNINLSTQNVETTIFNMATTTITTSTEINSSSTTQPTFFQATSTTFDTTLHTSTLNGSTIATTSPTMTLSHNLVSNATNAHLTTYANASNTTCSKILNLDDEILKEIIRNKVKIVVTGENQLQNTTTSPKHKYKNKKHKNVTTTTPRTTTIKVTKLKTTKLPKTTKLKSTKSQTPTMTSHSHSHSTKTSSTTAQNYSLSANTSTSTSTSANIVNISQNVLYFTPVSSSTIAMPYDINTFINTNGTDFKQTRKEIVNTTNQINSALPPTFEALKAGPMSYNVQGLMCDGPNSLKKSCICSIDNLISALQEKSLNNSLKQPLVTNVCERYIPLNNGIKFGSRGRRHKRSLTNYSNGTKGVGGLLAIKYSNIDTALNIDYDLNATGSHKYCLPGTILKIPCAEGKNLSTAHYNITWTQSKCVPLTGGNMMETPSGYLMISNINSQDSNNYTCTISNNESGIRTFMHEVLVIVLPTFKINTTILYEMSQKCSGDDVEVLKVYLKSDIINILCGAQHRVCKIDVQSVYCLADRQGKNYLYTSLLFHMEELKSIIPSLNVSQCGVLCQLKIYTRLVAVVANNIQVFETQPSK